jgi:hypothetical protein
MKQLFLAAENVIWISFFEIPTFEIEDWTNLWSSAASRSDRQAF